VQVIMQDTVNLQSVKLKLLLGLNQAIQVEVSKTTCLASFIEIVIQLCTFT